jgi:transposase InsO family protein
MGVTAFTKQPDCRAVCGFLGRAISKAKKAPRHIVCDRGSQFDSDAFRKWCKKTGIQRPRYGRIGKHGSIAVVERSILTIKCLLMLMPFISYRREEFARQLLDTAQWYNESRPHTWLGGKTPNEMYHGTFPANRRPRYETRAKWPRGSPCAHPWALVRGSPGVKLALDVSFYRGHKHLPIIGLKRVG